MTSKGEAESQLSVWLAEIKKARKASRKRLPRQAGHRGQLGKGDPYKTVKVPL